MALNPSIEIHNCAPVRWCKLVTHLEFHHLSVVWTLINRCKQQKHHYLARPFDDLGRIIVMYPDPATAPPPFCVIITFLIQYYLETSLKIYVKICLYKYLQSSFSQLRKQSLQPVDLCSIDNRISEHIEKLSYSVSNLITLLCNRDFTILMTYWVN